MKDTEIILRYFKARGLWSPPDLISKNGNKILTDYPAFKEHVLEVMGEEGFQYRIDSDKFAWFIKSTQPYYKTYQVFHEEEIKDNNILHAAVIGATNYFEGKNEAIPTP